MAPGHRPRISRAPGWRAGEGHRQRDGEASEPQRHHHLRRKLLAAAQVAIVPPSVSIVASRPSWLPGPGSSWPSCWANCLCRAAFVCPSTSGPAGRSVPSWPRRSPAPTTLEWCPAGQAPSPSCCSPRGQRGRADPQDPPPREPEPCRRTSLTPTRSPRPSRPRPGRATHCQQREDLAQGLPTAPAGLHNRALDRIGRPAARRASSAPPRPPMGPSAS